MNSMSIAQQPIALQHFDYSTLDQNCSCSICVDWRAKREVYHRALALTEGHGRSCMCEACKAMRSVRTAYHASDERRNLYCEMSFHAGVKHISNGPRVMEWLMDELTSGRRTDGWWEGRAPYYPLAYWFRQAEQGLLTMAAAVSGAVVAIVTGAATILAAVTGVSGVIMPAKPPRRRPHLTVVYSRPDGEIPMKSDFIAAAEAEEKQLVAELQKSPVFQRLEAVRDLMRRYGEIGKNLIGPTEMTEVKLRLDKPKAGQGTRQEIAAASAEFLKGLGGGPADTKAILAALTVRGITVAGDGKAARVLAIHLRNTPGFSFAKREGFRYADAPPAMSA